MSKLFLIIFALLSFGIDCIFAQSNSEVLAIFTEDQTDRAQPLTQELMPILLARDSVRLSRIKTIYSAGKLTTGDDFLYAAFIFQHSQLSQDYLIAYELARKAADFGVEKGKWLSAASKDRYLLSIGKLQIYGTQFSISQDGVWALRPMDSSAVTDEDRKNLNVPTLHEAYLKLLERNTKKAK